MKKAEKSAFFWYNERMYSVKIGNNAEAHDQFLSQEKLANLLQTSNWGKIKDSWRSEIISFENENQEIVASFLVLLRPLPLGFTMLYVPRAILGMQEEKLLKFILDELKKYGKQNKALFVKFDPAVRFDESAELRENLVKLGAKWSGRTADMHETIQPRFNAVIHAEDFSEENLDKKTKQFLRKARNSAPEITFGGAELVEEFAALMKKTEARKNVSLRNAEYYTKLLETYGKSAFITLVKYDMGKVLAGHQSNLTKTQDNLTKAKNEKRVKVLNDELAIIEKNIAEVQAMIDVHGTLIPVAGTLTIDAFGNAETLYAGTDTDFQKYYPSYLAWFETVQHAFDEGAKTLNMGGLENSLSENDGLLKFKKHFNPRIEEYVGEFDLPVNKLLFAPAMWAYKKRKMS